MKAYIFSKNLTKTIIVLSGFLLFLTAVSIYLGQGISADTTNGVAPCELPGTPSVSVNSNYDSITVSIGANTSSKLITYKVQVTDSNGALAVMPSTGSIQPFSGSNDNITVLNPYPGTNYISVPNLNAGQYSVSVTFSDGTGADACSHTENNTISITDAQVPTVDCSKFPAPSISIGGGTIKQGESIPVELSNRSDFDYITHIYLSDGSGNYHEKASFTVPKQRDIGYPVVASSSSQNGKHHIKVKVYNEDGACMVGAKEIKFCISSQAPNCVGPDENITPLGGSGSGSGGGGSWTDVNIEPSTLQEIDSIMKRIAERIPEIIAALAFLGIIIGGFMYMTAGGNETATAKGRRTILYSIVGLVLAALSYVIVRILGNMIK